MERIVSNILTHLARFLAIFIVLYSTPLIVEFWSHPIHNPTTELFYYMVLALLYYIGYRGYRWFKTNKL